MPKIPFYTIFAIIILNFGFAANINAANNAIVEDVEIYARGESGVDARTKAIEEGYIKAFEKIVQNIQPKSYKQILSQVKVEDITNNVLDFTVSDEKITTSSYKANLRVNFKKDFIAKAFAEVGTETAVETLPSDKIEVIAYYLGLDEWQNIRKKLELAVGTQSINIKSISNKLCMIELANKSSKDNLVKALVENGLKVRSTKNVLVITS